MFASCLWLSLCCHDFISPLEMLVPARAFWATGTCDSRGGSRLVETVPKRFWEGYASNPVAYPTSMLTLARTTEFREPSSLIRQTVPLPEVSRGGHQSLRNSDVIRNLADARNITAVAAQPTIRR